MHAATTHSFPRYVPADRRTASRPRWWVRLDHSRLTALALVIALSLIAAQVSAIFTVVQGQVQRAQLREAQAAKGQVIAQARMQKCLSAAQAQDDDAGALPECLPGGADAPPPLRAGVQAR